MTDSVLVFCFRTRGLIRNSPPSSRTRSEFWLLKGVRKKSSHVTTEMLAWALKPPERWACFSL